MGFHVKTPKRSSGAREFVREHPEEARVAVCTGLTLSRPSCRWLRAHRAADGRRSDEESCCRRAFGKTIQAGHTDLDGLVYASRLTGEDVYAVYGRTPTSSRIFKCGVRQARRACFDPATSKCESSALIAPCEPRYSSQPAATLSLDTRAVDHDVVRSKCDERLHAGASRQVSSRSSRTVHAARETVKMLSLGFFAGSLSRQPAGTHTCSPLSQGVREPQAVQKAHSKRVPGIRYPVIFSGPASQRNPPRRARTTV